MHSGFCSLRPNINDVSDLDLYKFLCKSTSLIFERKEYYFTKRVDHMLSNFYVITFLRLLKRVKTIIHLSSYCKKTKLMDKKEKRKKEKTESIA